MAFVQIVYDGGSDYTQTTQGTGGFTYSAPTSPSSPLLTPPPLTPSVPPTAPLAASTPTAGSTVALTTSGTLPVTAPATALKVLTADPASPVIGQFWYRSDTSQLCVRHNATTTKRVTLA